MTAKEHRPRKANASQKQPTGPSNVRGYEQASAIEEVVQRARLDPVLLTLRDMMHLQRTIGNRSVNRLLRSATSTSNAKPNHTGLPDHLKAGVESLSGLAMDDVRVHYNSSEPADVQALAYTEGTDIHIAPGQERHLPHEAWHVVQQKQGRVAASIQTKSMAANVDSALEAEADAMGERANTQSSLESRLPSPAQAQMSGQVLGQRSIAGPPVRQFRCGSRSKTRHFRMRSRNAERDDRLWKTNLNKVGESGKFTEGDIIELETAGRYMDEETLWETVSRRFQEYVIDENTADMVFYSATRKKVAPLIRKNGFDPALGGAILPKTVGEFNSRGFVYFSQNRKTADRYGSLTMTEPYVVLRFNLPIGTKIIRDHEMGEDALRTQAKIPPEYILG